MTTVLIAVPPPRAAALAEELELEGVEAITVAATPAGVTERLGRDIDAAVVPATRGMLTAALIFACDRAGVRIIALGDVDNRVAARLGIGATLPSLAAGWEVVAALAADVTGPASASVAPSAPHRVTAIWGPQGAPGRSTVAIQLAVELARTGRTTALVDADTAAPSLALLLGLGDDAPGIAAACRRAESGGLDAAELTRLAVRLGAGGVELDVLAGINRPSRWPELSSTRMHAALSACRAWTEETVVDVSASLDADDEATYDVVGPRRHAATSAVLCEADLVVAVASADPVGISRFLRDHAEVRRLIGTTPIRVVVNSVRPGPLGIDARGQVRRTLERFAGITDVTFLPFDQRAADAALLHARPMADVTPRSALVAAVRRLAVSLSPAGAAATAGSSRGSSRVARRLRSALSALAGSPDAGDPASAS
ncbi:P-loop NTPase [Microbacterium sp. p3-SID336]|uniref:AAA family ATPase n=1 Tax=Microbacterium sp. p3-SID336 TaxID=2916212 RepID=UPI0021A277D3|nr:P-loop NTPase [Microbacterium sp. p3-SID336]MCT1479928.1 P-loop NTPase [Microbacterium sp. p3-SID336]